MEPDEIKPSIGKKFLILLLWILGVFFVLAITAFILTERKKAREGAIQNNTPPPALTLTEAEKISKIQNEEIDKIRGEFQAQGFSPSTTTTTQSQIKTIDTIKTQTLKQEPAVAAPKKTIEQQLQELDALRSATIK
ncbi:MAG: hypothetical protein UV24_C0029G0002 [Candidatus Nomurabacteria bacterium GW2011_GWA2_42_41]|nr:MAG: hypothetical protein UV24_C0029G0002 [Candidatus Nomurabacteria bacterium GW2011_GWA2_42_41]